MPHVLALDQGTTSSRAIVFDETGEIVSVAQQEFEQISPSSGWVEHKPNDIWNTQRDVAQQALQKANMKAADISALGITNQRETAILWERATGKPVANAIVWQDRRTSAMCDQFKADGREPLVQQKTGLVIDAYFSASKVAWLLNQDADLRRRAEAGELAFGTVDSWLVWNLTGGELHATDVTNASRTMLWDIHRGEWDDELLGLFNIPRSMLPEVRCSSEVLGQVKTGTTLDGISIAGIAGDQQAALFGQACFEVG